jgi:hypothetical protein
VAPRYEALTRFLEDQPDGEALSLTFHELDQLVRGLPPSASARAWWANTAGHSQSRAWLRTGRRVIEVRLGEDVVFSPAGGDILEGAKGNQGEPRTPLISDGVSALKEVLDRSGYNSIVEAVAAHTIFLHPVTVAQTSGQPVFPVVRDPTRRGQIQRQPDGRFLLLDDNTTPTQAFLWAARRRKGLDVQYNHVWGDPRNRDTYTALWNVCVTPAFLAKTTDGSNHPEVLSALRLRSYDLYGMHPNGEELPAKPEGYDSLKWMEPPDAVDDLETVLRTRLASAPRGRPAIAARKIGWLFSSWEPDTTLPSPNDVA